MAQAPVKPALTYDEYLAFEREAEGKHEFIHGEIVGMSGGSRRHAAIAMNIGGTLFGLLAGKPCRPTSADQRIYVPLSEQAFYADVVVVCGDFQSPPEDPDAITNPTVIVEVLSPSTADRDRGTKFDHYRQLPSLTDYLLVDQHKRQVDHRHRMEPGQDLWLFRTHTGSEVVSLEALGVSLSLDAIYANLERVDAPDQEPQGEAE